MVAQDWPAGQTWTNFTILVLKVSVFSFLKISSFICLSLDIFCNISKLSLHIIFQKITVSVINAPVPGLWVIKNKRNT